MIAEDLSSMKLDVAVDEADVGEVKAGQKATFTVDAFPGKVFPATITRVDLGSNLSATAATTSTAQQVVSYGAKLSVANPDLQLRPGMTATASIATSARADVLLVPNAALRFNPDATGAGASRGVAGALVPRRPAGAGQPERTATLGKGAAQTVYVKDAAGKPKRIDVVTGETNGAVTEVLSGALRPGMAVITGQLSAGASQSASKAAPGASPAGARGGQRGN